MWKIWYNGYNINKSCFPIFNILLNTCQLMFTAVLLGRMLDCWSHMSGIGSNSCCCTFSNKHISHKSFFYTVHWLPTLAFTSPWLSKPKLRKSQVTTRAAFSSSFLTKLLLHIKPVTNYEATTQSEKPLHCTSTEFMTERLTTSILVSKNDWTVKELT